MELAEIDDDIEAFLIESYENLDEIERNIIDLEKIWMKLNEILSI